MKKLGELSFLPRPRKVSDRDGAFRLLPGTCIVLASYPPSLLGSGRMLQAELRSAAGLTCPIAACTGSPEGQAISLRLEGTASAGREPAEGYAITIEPAGVHIAAAGRAGIHYAAITLAQAVRECGPVLPCGDIADHPDFPVRGVMLDVSRDKVPTIETLFALVDMLCALKVNQVQLYTEHAFAYRGHEEVWAEASPLTGEEVLLLDAYCRERFIELVPNQNSFGHMMRWLTLPRYRHLAACPEGCLSEDGRQWPPFSLDPSSPACVEFLDGLYGQLLPHFRSRLFNVGCDETFDIDQGRNRERCAREGKGRVYLEFLSKIHALVKRHGRRMLYWGDIVMQHPELVPELPRDAVALEWGYEADHPFEDHCRRFAAAGLSFYVCPGTSSWNSIAGRADNCLANLRSAAESGLRHGASGYLNTDWGDNGHWQVLPVSFLGLAAGAAFSWSLAQATEESIMEGLDLHVFRDRARVTARLARELGNLYRHAGALMHNESCLFHILQHPQEGGLPRGVTEETLRKTRERLDAAASSLAGSRMERDDAGVVGEEFANTIRVLGYACNRGLAICRGDAHTGDTRQRLEAELSVILGEYRRLWLLRNRIGGLSDSTRRFEALRTDRGILPL
jgi:hypothetical protein